MASLFRPPESSRKNSRSPRLKLPPLNNIQANTSLSNGPSPRPTDSPAGKTNISPLSRPSSTTSSQMKRPLPPPLPKLNVNVSETSSINSLDGKMKQLSINDKTATHSPLSANTNASGKENFLANGNTNNPNASVDSFLSNLISAYDQSGSSYTSPIRSEGQASFEESNNHSGDSHRVPGHLLENKDIDELSEEVWHYKRLMDEIQTQGILGEGAGGSVAKCKLKHGQKIFALKTINTLNGDPEFQKQLLRELQFNKSFKSDYIVRYYGMFTDEQHSSIYIAMEYMGGKSLEAIYKNLLRRNGRIGEKILGKIAESVLRGLSYLHEKKVIHRDIKPQNILLNEEGQVKLCDFGVSGEAVNSLATTFTGTSFYMAPERIQGQPYSVTCDVWSLGLTVLEVAQGHFPFGPDKMATTIAPIELLTLILTFTPHLDDEPEKNIKWSRAFKSFIEFCLRKEARERPSPRQMIQHPWIQGQMKKQVDMKKFITKCWQE